MPPPRRSPPRRPRGFRPIKLFDPREFLAIAGIGRTIQEYRAKQAIFSQGQSSDAVYYIQEGKVRLSVLSKQGKEATVALLGRGDFLGEGCIASDQPVRLATATSCTTSSSQLPSHDSAFLIPRPDAGHFTGVCNYEHLDNPYSPIPSG